MKDRTEITQIALPIALEVVAVSLFIAMVFVWISIYATESGGL